MGGTPVTLDFSRAQPIPDGGQGITLDFSKAQRIDAATPEETGVWAGVKRNTVGLVAGLYHAFADPATDEERQELLKKVRGDNQKYGDKIPETLATNPSTATLAYHRLIDAPATYLNHKGDDEVKAANDLIKNEKVMKGASLYLSGLTDKALSTVPLAGPYVNSIAERYERGDVSGAATDIAAGVVAQHGGKIIKSTAGGLGDIRDYVASKIYTPEGEFTPGTDALTHPLTKGPEYLLRKAVPQGPTFPGAPLPSSEDFYANRAEALTKRGSQQAILDRAALQQGKAVPISKGPYYSDFKEAQAPNSAGTPMRPGGRIVDPNSAPPDVRITYQSAAQGDLLRQVMTGDRAAIAEWQRRSLPLPEGVRFLVEDAGSTPWRNYKR